MSHEQSYILPGQSSEFVGPIATHSPSTTASSTTSYTDTDYSSDEGTRHHMDELTTSSLTDLEDTKKDRLGKKRRKGKKQRIKTVPKDKVAAKQRRLLKELKRKLLKDIDSKQDELSGKALELEDKIVSLETDIEYSKQSMEQFEDKLAHIKKEMHDIDHLKANISLLMKGGRKLGGKDVKPEEILPESLLKLEGKHTDEDIAKSLKEFLQKEISKRSGYIPFDDSGAYGFQPYELDARDDLDLRALSQLDKRQSMDSAAMNLEAIMSHALNDEHMNE